MRAYFDRDRRDSDPPLSYAAPRPAFFVAGPAAARAMLPTRSLRPSPWVIRFVPRKTGTPPSPPTPMPSNLPRSVPRRITAAAGPMPIRMISTRLRPTGLKRFDSIRKYADPHTSLGLMYGLKGDLEKALAECSKAIHLDRERLLRVFDSRVCLRLLHEGKADLAIADYTEAIRLDPTDATYYANRAGVYTTKGDYEAAMTDCMEAIRLNPREDNAYNTRGWAHWMRQEVDAAIADYTEAIRLNPSHKKAYGNRGFALLGKLDYDKAIADFYKHRSARSRTITMAICTVDYVLRTKEQYDKAIADLDAVIRLRPDWPLPYEMRGAFWVANGNPERGLADFRAMLRLNPKDSAARFRRPRENRHFRGESSTRRTASSPNAPRPSCDGKPRQEGHPAVSMGSRKFAGEDLHEKIYWDSSDPPQHTTADHQPPKPGLPGRIRLAARYNSWAKEGRRAVL